MKAEALYHHQAEEPRSIVELEDMANRMIWRAIVARRLVSGGRQQAQSRARVAATPPTPPARPLQVRCAVG